MRTGRPIVLGANPHQFNVSLPDEVFQALQGLARALQAERPGVRANDLAREFIAKGLEETVQFRPRRTPRQERIQRLAALTRTARELLREEMRAAPV